MTENGNNDRAMNRALDKPEDEWPSSTSSGLIEVGYHQDHRLVYLRGFCRLVRGKGWVLFRW
jgi:hypothetical protein